jgi:DNA polymerase III subunit gamma/tau
MSYLVLARKWRPQTFEAVVGQEHVTRTLKNAITTGRVAHAFLFAGARGVGKTTAARLLAKALNCIAGPTPTPCNECENCTEITRGNAIDVSEIDGASHRGINEVRDIIESVKYRPAKSRYKAYIIDEVHQLTPEAFNALLKTLEEPPEHVKFIFATTEPHKVPHTILSRCQRYDFRRIPLRELTSRLRFIVQQEEMQVSEAGLSLIAREADGSLRDAESLLEQVLAFAGKEVEEKDVAEVLGVVDRQALFGVAGAVLDRDAAQALRLVGELYRYGYDTRRLCRDLVEHLRNLVVAKVFQDAHLLGDLPDHEMEEVMKQAGKRSLEDLQRLFKLMVEGDGEVSRSVYPQLLVELTLVKLATLPPLVPIQEILAQIAALEARLGSGPAGDNEPQSALNEPQPALPAVKKEGDNPTPANPPAAENKTDGKGWEEFLAFVRGEKLTLFFSLSHSRMLALTPTLLQIGVEKEPYLRELKQKDNQVLLQDLARRFFQQELEVELCRDPAGSDLSKSPAAAKPAEGTKATAAADPLVKTALEVLGGEIQAVRSPRSSG